MPKRPTVGAADVAASSVGTAAAPNRPRRGVVAVLVGSLMSGIGIYGFQILATRNLGEQAYAPVSVLWTLQYLLFAVALYPVESYTNRLALIGEPAELERFLSRIALAAPAAAAATAAAAVLLRDLFSDGDLVPAGVLAASVLTYTAYVVTRGLLAAEGRLGAYALVTAAESVVRVLALLALVLLGLATTERVSWLLPVGAAASGFVLVFVLRRRLPVPATTGAGPSPAVGGANARSGPGRYIAFTLVSNGAAQLLLAAAPLLAVGLGGSAAEVSICFVTVTLVRAPLVIGFGGLLSTVLPQLVRQAEAGDDAALRGFGRRILFGSLLCAGLSGVAAAAIGPDVVAALFGAGFRPPALFAALAAGAAVLASGNLLLDQALVARGSEARLLVPWLTALAAAGIVAATSRAEPLRTVAAAFLVGEVVAMLLLVGALLTAAPLRSTPVPDKEVARGA